MAQCSKTTSSMAKQQEDSDEFAMGILQSLFSQQDEHQRILDQLEILGLFWDKQQKWNQYASKNKDLREKVRQVAVKHEKQNEDRRIQKLIMLHQHEVDEEKSRKEQSIEMQEVRKELTEHRREWKGVVDDLNSHQAAMHTHLSGRILTKEGKQQQLDQNKEVLKTIMQKVQQRMQPKQVATGGSAKEKATGDATGGANMSRSTDDSIICGGGEGSRAEKVAGKKRRREEAASGETPSRTAAPFEALSRMRTED